MCVRNFPDTIFLNSCIPAAFTCVAQDNVKSSDLDEDGNKKRVYFQEFFINLFTSGTSELSQMSAGNTIVLCYNTFYIYVAEIF